MSYKKLTLTKALVFSAEIWQYLYETGNSSKHQFIQKYQQHEMFNYSTHGAFSAPFNYCWLCEFYNTKFAKMQDVALCCECPLGSCTAYGTPFHEWSKPGIPIITKKLWAKVLRDRLIRAIGERAIWPEK